MPLPRPKAWTGVASGLAIFAAAFAAAIDPPPSMTVGEWAEAKRQVSPESGSPYPGAWSNELAPYGVEIMECLSFSHPCREVSLKKSHQIAGTEFGVNLFGYVVDLHPSPVVIVLPTLDEAKKYDNIKLQPTIEATPALRAKVREQKSRDSTGSTMSFKRFRGGFCQLTGANSSTGLQMISGRVLIAEEISEWPADAGNRGDPLAQAEKRLTAWSRRGQKKYFSSTPHIKGDCRISDKYEASDQRRYYVPCPHCGVHQVLVWGQMKWRSETAPHGAHYVCAANGCVIEHYEKREMVARGRWVKTYPDDGAEPGKTIDPEDLEGYCARASKGRQPGFAIWQAYSPFVDWGDTIHNWLEAKDKPLKEKTFTQQDLGEPYEESADAPDFEKLFLRRADYKFRVVPPGGLFITAGVDVQGNRLEFAVYAWGIGLTSWLIDKDVILGDPADDAVWRKLDDILERRYEDQLGNLWPIDAFGVDAGYLSNRVYLFSRRHSHNGKVYALDGRDGWKLPAIGTPTKKAITFSGKKMGTAQLWPVGGWDMKSELYASLRKTIEGPDEDGHWRPGTAHAQEDCDQEHFKQLTVEFLAEVEKNGRMTRVWKQSSGQANEQHDMAVYARALAHHLSDSLRPEQWADLAARRGARPRDVQRDLAEVWAVPAIDSAAATVPPAPAKETPTPPIRGGKSRWLS